MLLEDSDIGETYHGDYSNFELRKAARAILFNENGEIALLRVQNGEYHKLPGGGVELDEQVEEALEREVLEEVGAKFVIEKKLGIIKENRGAFKQFQESHFYICKTTEIVGNPDFTEQEMSDGFNLLWCSLDCALNLLNSDKPTNYVGKFINRRDLIALENVSGN